jgi:hypothetical protein
MAEGYKVVTVCLGGNLVSYVQSREAGVLGYAVGETTVRPEGFGPLAVFATFAQAKSSLDHDGSDLHHAIYRCEYAPSEETGLWTPRPEKPLRFPDNLLPDGTVFADHVTLLEKVCDNRK